MHEQLKCLSSCENIHSSPRGISARLERYKYSSYMCIIWSPQSRSSSPIKMWIWNYLLRNLHKRATSRNSWVITWNKLNTHKVWLIRAQLWTICNIHHSSHSFIYRYKVRLWLSFGLTCTTKIFSLLFYVRFLLKTYESKFSTFFSTLVSLLGRSFGHQHCQTSWPVGETIQDGAPYSAVQVNQHEMKKREIHNIFHFSLYSLIYSTKTTTTQTSFKLD
jgi:hypothetical protein